MKINPLLSGSTFATLHTKVVVEDRTPQRRQKAVAYR
jgi:hypothetical protein